MSTWFTYDQFEFIYHWTPKLGDPFWGEEASKMLYWLGIAAGICAGCGGIPTVAYSFEMSGIILLWLYAVRFLTFVQFFTNHNYLFLLLGFLVVISGGGSYFPPPKKATISRIIQKSEWVAILIRIQYAVVYFYASLWKITPNWLDGSICKMIFTTFQEQGVNRGVPWKELYEEYGDVLFQFVALGGILLDSGMFCALALRRPDPKTTKLFTRLSVMFHGFVCFTMSQRIGYTFPSCCLAGSLIFYPIGNDPKYAENDAQSKKDDDAKDNNNQPNGSKKTLVTPFPSDEGSLPQWVWRYATGAKSARATRRQRFFALYWTLFQIGMPLRMPIISQNTFPFTSRCYRWSWTMMLHARSSYLLHSGKHEDGPLKGQMFYVPFDLMFLYPECAGVVPIQRKSVSGTDLMCNTTAFGSYTML
jgi:Vitamin K-dependent gamma-carboxylase